MDQNISFPDFVQGALESLDQLGGEFSYESYRVAQEKGYVFDNNLPDRGI